MKSKPLVTVGIPAYNAERFIALAIKSVLAQTYSNLESIITDDGSSDRTVEVARSFNDSRIKVLSDGENHGISYRLNQQIDLARGKYFCRMDADDIMMPDRIEKQVEYLEEHSGVDVIGGGVVVIDDENRILGKRIAQKETKLDFAAWLKGLTFVHPTVCGKLQFFKNFKYSDSFKGVEDVELWQRASKNKTLIIIPRIFNFYREPLSFKLQIYCFRGRQFRKLLRLIYSQNSIGLGILTSRLMGNYIRCAIATLLHKLNLDHLLIARRNAPVYNSECYYNLICNLL